MSYKKLNDSNFEQEVLNHKGTVLVDFYADWCGPCKMLAPIVDEIARERSDIVVGKVNVDESRFLAGKYEVMSIPTLVVFQDGKPVQRSVGLQAKENILNLLG